MARQVLLRERQSTELLKLDSRGPGTYEVELLIEGNSILSSLFVDAVDGGASVAVEYYETTTGGNAGEITPLLSHATFSSPAVEANKITVTRIHNKPILKAVVTGGNVTFGVYGTVVSSFASDLDTALVFDEQLADLARNKAIPIAGYDPATGKFEFLHLDDGDLPVSASISGEISVNVINKRLYGTTAASVPATINTEISYTVPALKTFKWFGGIGTSDGECEWTVEVNGLPMIKQLNRYTQPNVLLHLGGQLTLVAGDLLEVKTKNRSIYGQTNEINTWIYGKEENV